MNNKKIVIISLVLSIFLFSALIKNVNADFSVKDTQSEAIVCPGSTTLFTSDIEGTGDFSVNLEGGASSFSTVVPLGFSLIADKKTLFIYSTPNSRVIPGKYNLNLLVNDGKQVQKSLFIINVADCHKIDIKNAPTKEVCGCNSERYSFMVKNSGNFQETYDLSLGGSTSQWGLTSESVITLNPGESREIFIDIKVPCNSKGVFDIVLNAKSRSSLSSASAKSEINVKKCYDYTTSIEKNFISFCERTQQIIPLKITNAATEKNTYQLKLSGPAWANLDRKTSTIEALGQDTINLILSPDYGTNGEFDIDVQIEDINGKIKLENNVRANVNQCNNVEVIIPQENERICQGLDKVYEISIKNTGQFPKMFKLFKNHEFVRTDKDSLNLNPGEEKDVSLEVDTSKNVPSGTYDIKITSVASDTEKIKGDDSFNLEVISGSECYKPEIKVSDIKIARDSSISQAIEILNNGRFETTYNIGISGTASSFIQLNPATISIKPGKSEIVYLYAYPSPTTKTGDYKATIFVRSKDTDTVLGSKNIDITVLASEELSSTEEPTINTTTTIQDNQTAKKEGFFSRVGSWLNSYLTSNQSEITGRNIIDNTTKIKDIKDLSRVTENTKFVYNNEEHELLISNIKNDSVIVVIKSNSTAFQLSINQEKDVDVNGDGKKDIKIRLLKIENGIPSLEVKEISLETENKKSLSEKFGINFNIRYLYAGLALIAVVIIILLFRNQISEFLEDDEEQIAKKTSRNENEEEQEDADNLEDESSEKVKELKIGRYVIALILLAIIYFVFRKYDLIEKLNPYRAFILGALIVLLIIIILVKYWNSMTDFFEEEDKPKKKNNKPKTKKKQ